MGIQPLAFLTAFFETLPVFDDMKPGTYCKNNLCLLREMCGVTG